MENCFESPIVRIVRAIPRPFRRHRLIKLITRFYPKWRIATFRFNGNAITTADLADTSARSAVITGAFEPEYFDIAKAFILPKTAVFDVGANAGFCSFGVISELKSRSEVAFHLFEANPHLSAMLHRAREHFPECRVEIHHACVSDKVGMSSLYIPDDHWGGAFISADRTGVSVPNLILDDYISANRIEMVSFVKMDIEGYEVHALRGMRNSLLSGKVGAVYLEVSAENLAKQGYHPENVIELLRELGCGCFWCKPIDFERGVAKGGVMVSPCPGQAELKVAPFTKFPTGYQTDLIAIPARGPFGGLVSRLDWSAS